MTSKEEFVRRCFTTVGTPYDLLDCIGVIRAALGIRCEGTNWLWDSINNASKYRYLTERLTWLPKTLDDGELLFKRTGNDVHHVGVVVNGGTDVLHSSPGIGVRAEPLIVAEWQLWGRIGKYVDYGAPKTATVVGGESDLEHKPEATPEVTGADEILQQIRVLLEGYYGK